MFPFICVHTIDCGDKWLFFWYKLKCLTITTEAAYMIAYSFQTDSLSWSNGRTFAEKVTVYVKLGFKFVRK